MYYCTVYEMTFSLASHARPLTLEFHSYFILNLQSGIGRDILVLLTKTGHLVFLEHSCKFGRYCDCRLMPKHLTDPAISSSADICLESVYHLTASVCRFVNIMARSATMQLDEQMPSKEERGEY